MKVVIRFKSGFELVVMCEKFRLSRHSMTGELMDYDIEGRKDNKPLFFRSEDVECVYRIMDAEGKDDAEIY